MNSRAVASLRQRACGAVRFIATCCDAWPLTTLLKSWRIERLLDRRIWQRSGADLSSSIAPWISATLPPALASINFSNVPPFGYQRRQIAARHHPSPTQVQVVIQ
jgi:hypothetical protein